MNSYSNCSVDELIGLLRNGCDDALAALFIQVKPIILNAARMYGDKMEGFDMDDLVQEGYILAWRLATGEKDAGEKFRGFFKAAVRNRYSEIFRNYCRHNGVVVAETVDFEGMGYNIVTIGEADFIKRRRERDREYSRKAYCEKKRKECEEKGIPFTGIRQRRTPEDQKEHRKAQAREYYQQHKEEMNRKNAERKRMKRLALKTAAAMLG
jgi:DNA-directed RNA polymerase specialized sigma24 family protein